MLSLILIPLITFVMLFLFARSRQTREKRHWTDQTQIERFWLSISLAGAIQFLYVTMIPGWIVAATVIGKFSETFLGKVTFGTVMIIANTIIYFPVFFLLLGLFSIFRKNKVGD